MVRWMGVDGFPARADALSPAGSSCACPVGRKNKSVSPVEGHLWEDLRSMLVSCEDQRVARESVV